MNPKLYLDIDGVFSDFDKAIANLGPVPAKGLKEGASEEDVQAMYDAMEKAGVSFWADMDEKPEAKELWDIVKSYRPVFLSSPGKFRYAPAGKIQWINKHFPGTPLFIEEDKYIYAEPDAILIDDMKKNTEAWKESGGQAILYKDPETTKGELMSILNKRMLTKMSSLIRRLVQGKTDFPIGWTDESNPDGMGYRIMTPEGMKVFDKEDKAAFLHEKRLVDDWLKKHQKMGQHIPKEWVEQLQKKKVDTLPPKALEQKSEYIRQGIADKEIKNPFIFLKNLNKVINYVKDMPNPTSHGFSQDLAEYSNDITPKIRKMNKGDILHLPKETQIKFLNTAEKLIDNGTLLRYMDDWYNEKEIQPAQRPMRKSLASLIRAFCSKL